MKKKTKKKYRIKMITPFRWMITNMPLHRFDSYFLARNFLKEATGATNE